MNKNARKSNSLSLQSPVKLIRGIGYVRAKALAELNIYSVQDFLESLKTEEGRLRVAGKIGMKVDAVITLQSRTEGELKKPEFTQPPAKWYKKRSSLYFLLAVVNILLIVAGVLIEATSFHQSHRPSYAVVALFKNLSDIPISDYKLRVDSTYNARAARTKVQLENQYDLCFGDDSLSNTPNGIFFPWLTWSTIKNASASIYIVEQRTKNIGEGWFTSEDIAETRISLPVTIEDISHLENYGGINLIIWFDMEKLAEARAVVDSTRHHTCGFEFSAEFTDDVDASFFDPFRRGTVFVLPLVSYNEAEYIGIENLPDDGLGPVLELEMRDQPTDYQIYTMEYFWTSTLEGELLRPADFLGHSRFVETSHADPIRTSLLFKSEGARWLPYLAGIIGLQIASGAIQLLRTRYRKS